MNNPRIDSTDGNGIGIISSFWELNDSEEDEVCSPESPEQEEDCDE